MDLTDRYEVHPDTFVELPKAEFDQLYRDGSFEDGPLVAEKSHFADEFGPYDPHRWAFGRLQDGRLVKCDTNKSEVE